MKVTDFTRELLMVLRENRDYTKKGWKRLNHAPCKRRAGTDQIWTKSIWIKVDKK